MHTRIILGIQKLFLQDQLCTYNKDCFQLI